MTTKISTEHQPETSIMKHIPTLTVVFYQEHGQYGYEYDDVQGLTQTEYGYITLGEALGAAYKHLKTFTVLPDIDIR